MENNQRKKPGPKRADANENKARPARIRPGSSTKLSVPESLKKEGYFYYWAIDGPDHAGKLAQMEAGWYEYVLDSEGLKVTEPAGSGNMHVLMRLPQELRDEDMAAEQKKNLDASQVNTQSLGNSEYVPMGRSQVMEREII